MNLFLCVNQWGFNMYYVIEIIKYKYSNPSHHLVFHNESLSETIEYKTLKTKLNKIEDENTDTEYVIHTPTTNKKAA